MTDYATMRTRIADEMVNDGDITTAQINYAIQDTIKQYERRPFYFNQSNSGSFSTVASQEYYSSSDLSAIPNIVHIIAATITSSGVKSALRAVDYQAIDDEQDGSVEGLPGSYAYFSQKIRLFPIPNAVYTVGLSYIARLTALSADSDSNAWTTDAEELIRQGAKRRIAINYLQSEELAARYAPFEREALLELMSETRRRLPNTVLRTERMLPLNNFDINRGW